MQSQAISVEEYISQLPEERQSAITQLRKEIKKNLPKGFQEVMNYGMIGYVVPHILYPDGYHCNPAQPLPFINIASQKSHIAVYHMGLYADTALLKWFIEAYNNQAKVKLDMGKSCIRFKKTADIPFSLIGDLAAKVTPQQWIACYEKVLKK
ncbi:MAG: DUF1801 domain-containing protein [Chitinophagaceae bacterium]|nr:DUF1801 domain-containing protein [Chitinophagaceae bacterium]